MLGDDYQYTMEFYNEAGEALGQVAVDVDFAPACEWTRLAAARKGVLAPRDYDTPASFLPIWHSKASRPYLGGFRVRIESNGSGAFQCDFSTRYFRDYAAEASQLFVKGGKLKSGDRFVYLLAAFPRQANSADHSARRFQIEDLAPNVPVRESVLSEFESVSAFQGDSDAELMPVFIPSRVLDETAVLTRKVDEVETGGFLIGHLHRDLNVPEFFLEVTAQIPAVHAIGELARLRFTPKTWSAAQAAISLRRKEELLLGWWHSHPVRHWECRNCPPEKQRTCALTHDFFSEHDRAVHRAVFSRAWSVALVVNNTPYGGPSTSVFGWKHGAIEPRGFYVTNRETE